MKYIIIIVVNLLMLSLGSCVCLKIKDTSVKETKGTTIVNAQSSLQHNWKIISINGKKSGKSVMAKANICFDNEGKFYGYTGLNRFFGEYFTKGSNLAFSHVGMTRMAGDEVSMKNEQLIIDAVNHVRFFKTKGNKLFLYSGNGDQVLSLRRV